ncbi:MAG: hypothetical protein HRT69_13345 [Flavobacteriaceae bacterium]|jgi:hypothetical protein|nr:hypothetical protein [Flavobacteriaceae bacterium]
MKARIDRFLNRFISKKLTVFLLATLFIYLGKIDPVNWVNLSMVYIGSQAAVDVIKQLRK